MLHNPNFVQRSPLSIYMRYEAAKNLTYYIISASESEECVVEFKNLLDLACHDDSKNSSNDLNSFFLQHPLEAHILLSKILFESSKGLIHSFRQSMFAQVFVDVSLLNFIRLTTNFFSFAK